MGWIPFAVAALVRGNGKESVMAIITITRGMHSGGEQVADHAVDAGCGERHHEYIPFLEYLNGSVDHQIVTRCRLDGHRGTGDARPLLDRRDIGVEEARAPLRLVDGGDAGVGGGAADGLLVDGVAKSGPDSYHLIGLDASQRQRTAEAPSAART